MTEKIRELNGAPIEAVLLAEQRGAGIDDHEKPDSNIQRSTCLRDQKTHNPLLLGVLEIQTKALKHLQGVINKIKAAKEPFGGIVKEAAKGQEIKVEVSHLYEVKHQTDKDKLKKLLQQGPVAEVKRVFALDDDSTTVYGRHALLKIGRETICKVIEFISPQLLETKL